MVCEVILFLIGISSRFLILVLTIYFGCLKLIAPFVSLNIASSVCFPTKDNLLSVGFRTSSSFNIVSRASEISKPVLNIVHIKIHAASQRGQKFGVFNINGMMPHNYRQMYALFHKELRIFQESFLKLSDFQYSRYSRVTRL